MMERETLGYGIGRPHVSRRLLDQTADAIGPLPGRELLVEPGRRSGLAVGIAQERAERSGADEIAQLIGADYGFGRHEISPDTQKPGAWPGFWCWVLARGAGRPGPQTGGASCRERVCQYV